MAPHNRVHLSHHVLCTRNTFIVVANEVLLKSDMPYTHKTPAWSYYYRTGVT